MNIGQLLRSMIGEGQPAEPKTLELKAGQVVKGMVLRLLADQQAMVSIDGVTVKARLEAPLKAGEATWLQVQPSPDGGPLVLSPASNGNAIVEGEESLALLLKSFALPDEPGNRVAARILQREGIPLTKETIRGYAEMSGQAPSGVPSGEWKQAALLAVKKGIPLSRETVAPLREVLYGIPLHQKLTSLREQAETFLSQPGASSTPSGRTLQQTVQLLETVLGMGQKAMEGKGTTLTPSSSLMAEEIQGGSRPPSAAVAARGSVPEEIAEFRASVPSVPPKEADGNLKGQKTARGERSGDRTLSGPATEHSPVPAPLPQTDSSLSAEDSHPLKTASTRPESGITGAENGEGVRPRKGMDRQHALIRSETLETEEGSNTPQERTVSPSIEEEPWIGKLLKAVGIDYEHHVARRLQAASAVPPNSMEEGVAWLEGSPEAHEAVRAAGDNLKSLLLQLTAADGLPSSLKDSVQQALQQVTGQQLLLASDRQSAFTYVTILLPFRDGKGDQTAAVHVQSRKGPRGELDPSNCRLVFDLQMKALGSTLVDVQVYDRLVSLQVLNNEPFTASLLESHKEEIANGLAGLGYRFLSLKCSSFPEQPADLNEANDAAGIPPVPAVYRSKPYKGVDLRI